LQKYIVIRNIQPRVGHYNHAMLGGAHELDNVVTYPSDLLPSSGWSRYNLKSEAYDPFVACKWMVRSMDRNSHPY